MAHVGIEITFISGLKSDITIVYSSTLFLTESFWSCIHVFPIV